MLIGYNSILQIYMTWGCGVLPLFIILILNFKDIFFKLNKNITSSFNHQLTWRTYILIIFGLFISVSCIRLQDTVLISTANNLYQLTKFNIMCCWLFGFNLLFLINLNKSINFNFNPQITSIVYSICYIWQIACSTGHPIVLLVCLEINLLLFLLLCLENNKTEAVLTNILILLWIGGIASIFAFLGYESITSYNLNLGLNWLWLGALFLKFILVPAQSTLFSIYQRWTLFQLTLYITSYYIPLLYFLLPLLISFTIMNSFLAMLFAFALSTGVTTIIFQFENISSPNRTIAISSLITICLLLVTILITN